MKYCPNCIEQLVSQTKNLGACSKWYVCPICGYRERPFLIDNAADRMVDRNKVINDSNYFKE